MANSETRAFRLPAEISMETVVQAVETYCQSKQMQTQYNQTADGYVFQAAQDSVIRTALGMRLATTVQFSQIDDILNVSIGAGEWVDKIGSSIAGLFVAWPLLATAGYGAYMQKKLPGEIFDVITRVLNGGQAVYTNPVPNYASPAMQRTAAPAMPMTACPNCGGQNQAEAKFCSQCGTPLKISCPNCGKGLSAGTKFCPECGTKIGE
ncbi:MAG: zinc ribbon domain-containing protein [Oscillospiraceae bacterium]|nr:zinc ribbon domain-containing protein [Oscillospiraceae bacterium]